MKNVNEYSTCDLPEAVYLSVKGIPLIDLRNDINGNRVIFVFHDSEEIKKYKIDYLNDGSVPVRSFYSTFKDLKRKVYEIMRR